VPPGVLGHLMHHLELHRPKELRVMMGEVLLNGVEQLLLGVSCEMCPTLAEGGPPVLVRDLGHLTLVGIVLLHLACPTEGAGV